MKKFIVLTLLLAGAGLIAGLVYGLVIDTPEYTSTSRLMVRNPKTANQARDYASIATSTSVLNQAKIDIGTSEDPSTLKDYVTAINLSGTNIISITVVTPIAEMSKTLNQAIINGIQEQARVLYQEDDNIVEVDPASDSQQTHNPKPFINAVMGVVAGMLIGVTTMLIFYPQTRELTGHEDRASPESSYSNTDTVSEDGDTPPARRPLRSSVDTVISEPTRKTSTRSRAARPLVKSSEAGEDDKELEDILISLEKKMKRR